jgi:hypothetical protein
VTATSTECEFPVLLVKLASVPWKSKDGSISQAVLEPPKM